MSKGNYPLLRPNGQPWTLTVVETERLSVWREAQVQERERFWPDDHATVKRPWVKVQ